jgi:hypothetical protein
MTRAFWVMIAFSFVCILAGAVVGFFGPSLFPAGPRPHAAAPQLGKPAP